MKVKAYGTEGKADMCKAITELVKRGRREGIERGNKTSNAGYRV